MSKILLGVSGGIAAYKSLEVVSKLRKRGEEIKIIMTEEATKFVAPLTFAGVGNCPVYVDAFKTIDGKIIHTTVSQWADVMIVAPLTANSAAKIRCGIADNLLTMTALAFDGPKIAVPSMNVRMYENPITLRNLSDLKKYGWNIVEPASGHLADGEYGRGRYPDTSIVLFEIDRMLSPHDYENVNVLVTAGPTREAIDPVRYVTNRSSGKMGYELATAARMRNANVKLISGPVYLKTPYGVERLNIESAQEMKEAVLDNLKWADVIIMAAAVADYKPANVSPKKIKKNSDELNLELVKTDDILKEISKARSSRHFIVGFAAETDDLIENAKKKLKEKSLDMIVANDVSRKDIGFDSAFNEVKILRKDGKIIHLQRNEKRLIAHNILDIIKSQRVKKS
jgi:phosphopantothenoylcysteine decarboxylase/phosphopantothenate--cysteine ligase